MSESKSSNDSFFLTIPILMMVMVVVVLTNSNNDENSLLTDEQKLEKQKVLALEQKEKLLKQQEDANWWNDNINYVLNDRPPLVVLAGGMLIFITLIKTSQIRSDLFDFRYSRWFYWLNIPTIFVLFVGIIYLTWVIEYFDPRNIYFNPMVKP